MKDVSESAQRCREIYVWYTRKYNARCAGGVQSVGSHIVVGSIYKGPTVHTTFALTLVRMLSL